jgi:6-phosphofructokinase
MGKLFAIFAKYDIRYFFYIGGNDSMDTVAKVSAYAEKVGYPIRVMGVPKTIDNDLVGTDHTPGFGSAAKYIAVTMQEILRDTAVYTVPAVTIVEIMGRDAGWLTASSALGRVVTGIEPDLVYLPERAFSYDAFYADVRKALEQHPNVVVAVSEGLRCADGSFVGEGTQSGAVDVFGHRYLAGTAKALELAVKAEIGCKVRSIELIDRKILTPVHKYLCESGEEFKIMILPDHPTPIRTRTHAIDPVPFMIYSSSKEHGGAVRFTEDEARGCETYIPKGHSLIELLTSDNI